MSGNYRVELSVSGRAVCQSTECKKAGTKIAKDVLRFGVWVEYDERGSWKWRHWGCVTGKVIQNIRDALDDGNSGYRWDCLDGYDGDEKGSLHKSPELQAKVRRCITQGFIDPEDFNGDPEMNKLGETGMRTKESKKKMAEEEKARNFQEKLDKLKGQLEDASGQNATELEQQIKEIESKLEKMANPSPTQAPKSGPAKRKANADEGDDGEQTKPAKKKRASKPKKEEDVGDEESISAPAKKPRAKKVKKEVEDDNEMTKEEAKPAPAKKSRAKIAKKEDLDDDEDSKPTLTKRAPAKKMKEEEDDDDDAEKVQAPKKRAPRGKKVKEEIEAESDAGEVSALKKRAPRGKKVKEEIEADSDAGEVSAPKKRAPRKKKDPAEEGQSASSKRAPAEKGGNTAKKETNNATPSLTDGSSLEDIEVTPATKDESTKPAKLPVDPPARMSDSEAINAEHAQDAVVEVTADFPAAGSKPKSKKGRAKSDLKAATSTRGSRSQATSAL